MPPELTTAYFADPTAHGAPPGAVHGIFNVPAAAIILSLTALLVRGTREVDAVQQHHRRDQGHGRADGDRVRRRAISTTPIGRRSFPTTPASSAISAGAAWCAARRWCSSPISASTPSRPRRRRRIIRSGTCRSALSARSIICTILYIAVAAVATGVVNYKELGVPDPMALVMDRTGVSWLAWAVKFGALAGLTTAILVLLYGQTRDLLRHGAGWPAAADLREAAPNTGARPP